MREGCSNFDCLTAVELEPIMYVFLRKMISLCVCACLVLWPDLLSSPLFSSIVPYVAAPLRAPFCSYMYVLRFLS